MPDSPAMSTPSKTIRPDVGACARVMQRPRVDLPEPDSPTTPRVSPFFSVKPTSATACVRRAGPSRPRDS
ncbi:Uncharacterised protein [Bordetella pertussis]|nr:Uncharacterised protein [Bordetella pertussis]